MLGRSTRCQLWGRGPRGPGGQLSRVCQSPPHRGTGRPFLDSWAPLLKRVRAVLVEIWTLLIHRQGCERGEGDDHVGGTEPATCGAFKAGRRVPEWPGGLSGVVALMHL